MSSKRTVVDPDKADRGDNKRGGSVVERIVRKLAGVALEDQTIKLRIAIMPKC